MIDSPCCSSQARNETRSSGLPVVRESHPIFVEQRENGLKVVSLLGSLMSKGYDLEDETDPATRYRTRKVLGDPRELVILDGIHREFRPEHSEKLRARLVQQGHSSEYGLISWTWNGELGMKLCINGQHRIGAINMQHRLVKSGKAPTATASQFDKIEMLEYYTESGEDIPISDIVILSSNANEKSGCVAPSSLADRMGTLFSFLSLNSELLGKSAAFVTNKIDKKGVLPSLRNRTIRRYVIVALALLKNERARKEFVRFARADHSASSSAPGGMSMGVLSNNVFTTSSPAAQVLAIICVNAHYNACREPDKISAFPSLKEGNAGFFFKIIRRLADMVEALALARDMHVYEIYDFTVGHSSEGRELTTLELISDLTKVWNGLDEIAANSWFASTRRLVLERLLSALPQKTMKDVDEAENIPSERIGQCQMGSNGASNPNTAAPAILDGIGNESDMTSKGDPLRYTSVSGDTPPKKRLKDGSGPCEEVMRTFPTVPVRRITRAQSAESRFVLRVQREEESSFNGSGNDPKHGRSVPSRTNQKSVKKAKRRKTKRDVDTARRRRDLDRFDDKTADLPAGVTQKQDLCDQLDRLGCSGLLYDDRKGYFPLRSQHPAVSVLGAEGYMKVIHSFTRYCMFEMAWSLFPRGDNGTTRDQEAHKKYLGGFNDRAAALSSLHIFSYGIITQVHTSLFRDGYAVVGLFKRSHEKETFPCGMAPSAIIDMKKCVDLLFDYFAADRHVPHDSGWWDENFWVPITNASSKEDVNARAAGATRMFSPRHASNETLLEADPVVYNARLYLDMYLAAIADVFRLRTHTMVQQSLWRHELDNKFEYNAASPLHIPNSGGRFILTCKDCLRQRPHCDFKQPKRESAPGIPSPIPSYFMIVSGPDGFHIYAWSGSHREINHSPEDIERLSRRNIPTAVWVPPYSVLIGRGDLHHAGAGWADWMKQPKSGRYKFNVRYHVYLQREGDYLGNHVFDKYENVHYRWQE